MDTTVEEIGGVVVAKLRAPGYMESTIGQYKKTIKALSGFACRRGGLYTPAVPGAVRGLDDESAHRPVQRAAQVRLRLAREAVRLICAHRSGGYIGAHTWWRGPAAGLG